MAQSTVSSPALAPSTPAPSTEERRSLGRWARDYPEPFVAVLLLAISTALVLWARTRPGFDPYGWLVWGHQTLHGSLDTNAAPSWKPLPYLFTLPYALFGHYELWLWMITAVALSLSGVFFGGRIAYRVIEAGEPSRRYAAWAAAIVAGLAVLGVKDDWHYILSFQSDPIIIALLLGAIDCHLSGRPRWAIALGTLGSLGRPEMWPFLALYSIWVWRYVPSARWAAVAGWLVVLALWFGIPGLTSRTPFVAASNALGSGRAPHGNKITETISRFVTMDEPVLEILALVALAFAALRRDWVTLGLAAIAVVWVVVEIAFALHGWPALQRYMFPAGAVVVVLAGIAVGRLLADMPPGGAAVRWAGVVVALIAVLALVPPAVSHARSEHKDLTEQRARTKQIGRLSGVIAKYGGPAAFHGCGEPLTRLEYQTILAWTLRDNVATVGFKYGPAVASSRPVVLFTPTSDGGWLLQALHQRTASCRRLPS